MRLILALLKAVPVFAMGYAALSVQLHQIELSDATMKFTEQAMLPNAQTDFMKDRGVRNAMKKVCGDVVSATASMGQVDTSCVRLLENTAN